MALQSYNHLTFWQLTVFFAKLASYYSKTGSFLVITTGPVSIILWQHFSLTHQRLGGSNRTRFCCFEVRKKHFWVGLRFKGLKEWSKKFCPLTHLFSIRCCYCCCCCCCCYCFVFKAVWLKKERCVFLCGLRTSWWKFILHFFLYFFLTETEFVCSVLTLTGLRLNWWDGECEPFRCWLFSAAARHCHGYTAARAGRTEGGFCWRRRGGEIPHCCNSRRVKKLRMVWSKMLRKPLSEACRLCVHKRTTIRAEEHKQVVRTKERERNLFIVFTNRKDIILF